MATDKQRVLAAVDNPYVRRALDIIATTEGAGKQGYYTEFGGGRLAAELEKAKVRERELEEAGAEASAALGRAIAEIKAALSGEPAAQETEEA